MTGVNKQVYYEQLSNHIKGEVRLSKLNFIAFVESEVDVRFWTSFFNKYIPNKKFDFRFETKTPNKNNASGVEQCMQYKPHLDNTFIVCIDSDYRYLMQEAEIHTGNHIFQTYTYSIENHYCYHSGLNEVCRCSCGYENSIFNFEQFFQEYSNIVYELFLIHLHFEKTEAKNTILDKSTFHNTINIHELNLSGDNWDIENNCCSILNQLKTKVDVKTNELKGNHTNISLDKLKKQYTQLGLTVNNVYLYIRGHNLESLTKTIINKVTDHTLNCEKKKLDNDTKAIEQLYGNRKELKGVMFENLMFEEYPEIIRIKNDIDQYFA